MNPIITILPFAYADWQADARGRDFCRGLSSLIEGRLRLIPEAEVHVQHLVARPPGEGQPHQYVMRANLWPLDEALELPSPPGAEPTHLVQGELALDEDIGLTLEVIDRNAGYCSFREKVTCTRDEFLRRLFPMLGRMADVIGGTLPDERRLLLVRRPTESFEAFESYLEGLSQRVEIHAGSRQPVPAAESFEPFRAALKTDPAFIEPCIAIDMLAQECFRLGCAEIAAREALREAADCAPHYAGFARTLGIYYFDSGKMEEAQRLLEEFLSRTGGRDAGAPQAYVRLARIHQESAGVAKAIALLRDALVRFPAQAELMEALGVCLAESGQREEAEELWRRVLDDDPTRTSTLANLAMVRWEARDFTRARLLFERAIESPDATEIAYTRFVDFLVEQSDLQKADEVATAWVEAYSNSWRNWLQLAKIRRRLGQSKAAEYCLDRAQAIAGVEDIDGEIAIARFAIAHPGDYHIFQQAMRASARAVRQRSGDAQRENPDTHELEYSNARETLMESVRVFSHLGDKHNRLPFLWRALAQSLAHLEQYESAVAAQERLVALVPRSAAARNTLGILLLRSGHAEPALAAMRRAIDLSPRTVAYRTNLVSALLETGRVNEAEDELAEIETDAIPETTLANLRRRIDSARARQEAQQSPAGMMRRIVGFLGRITRAIGGE